MTNPRILIALLLLLAGTNLFTHAMTRWHTTQHVLVVAQSKVDTTLKAAGVYDAVYPRAERENQAGSPVHLALSMAGQSSGWLHNAWVGMGAGIAIVIASFFVAGNRRERQLDSDATARSRQADSSANNSAGAEDTFRACS